MTFRNQERLFWFVVALLQVLLFQGGVVHAIISVANHHGGSSSPTSTTSVSRSTTTAMHNNSKEETIRYRCRGRVAYHGGGFRGFQVQQQVIGAAWTVQGKLEHALSRQCDRPVRVVRASRTDAGVHARGQAIYFDLLRVEESSTVELELDHLERAMNSLLTPDVRVWNLKQAPPPPSTELFVPDGTRSIYKYHSWNVMRHCHSKPYVYRFSISPAMDPHLRHN